MYVGCGRQFCCEEKSKSERMEKEETRKQKHTEATEQNGMHNQNHNHLCWNCIVLFISDRSNHFVIFYIAVVESADFDSDVTSEALSYLKKTRKTKCQRQSQCPSLISITEIVVAARDKCSAFFQTFQDICILYAESYHVVDVCLSSMIPLSGVEN